MNKGQIRTMVREFLNEPSPAFWTDATLDNWINQGVRKVSIQIKNTSRYHFTTRATFPTVAGQEYYQLPANLKDLKLVSKITTDQTELPLAGAHWPNPFVWTEDPLPTSTSTNPTDLPAGYWIVGQSIRLLPIPTAAVTIRLYYEARLVDLIDDNEIPACDEDYHDMVAMWATKLARVKNSELSTDIDALWAIREQDLYRDTYHRIPAPALETESYLQGLP